MRITTLHPRHTRRIVALLIGMVLALSLLLSVAFILLEQHHHCSGEHCEICAAVAHNVAFLKTDTNSSYTTSGIESILCVILLLGIVPSLPDIVARSPVSLKVKLSD